MPLKSDKLSTTVRRRNKMKALILLFSVIISVNSFAVDDSVFAEKYPGMRDYQNTSLQGLNLYFFTFLSKSVVFNTGNGNYQIQFQNDSGETVLTLNARITRKIINGDLQEYVQYILPNASTFDYYLKKTGLDQSPSADEDLLIMNFKNVQSNYEVAIVPLMTKFEKTGIKDYLSFGFLGITISIQTIYKELEATRSYIYFYKGMPNPQSYLTVQVVEESESAKTFNYIHSSKGAEISPKYFFQGLQEGSSIFKEFSQISLGFIKSLGFPSLKGIN